MSCPECHAELPPSARFCNVCGAAQDAPTCVACLAPLALGSKFCHECGTSQVPKPPVALQPVAARRLTSVLFGDLVGFTTLSESRDQEEVRELLSRYFDECRQIIGRYDGTVEKFIGDAVMAVWGTPTAHEDDAERAVRAGLELVAAIASLGEDLGVPDLAMRVGIVTGEVAVTIGAQQQGMVAGDAVNTAARVQSVAIPGQVWVDETTRLLTASAITYADAGLHSLKGKLDPVPLWSVRAVVAAVGGAQRVDGLEGPLVGRDRELRLVKELFHRVEEQGTPSLVVVDGDAGVGKTRLLWELEKYTDGMTLSVKWHAGRCASYGEGMAYFALAEAIRGRLRATTPDENDQDALLDAGLAEFVPDETEREWVRPRLAALLGIGSLGTYPREDLFAAWTRFLERVAGSGDLMVLVIDDAQHADDGLLAFVENLLTTEDLSAFVVLATRPGLLEVHPQLATNRRATVLHLSTLGDADMRTMLAGLVSGVPDDVLGTLVARSEGVPLFAVETVRSLIDQDLIVPRDGQYILADGAAIDLDTIGAPASLQALIAARLDSLDPVQRRVVDAASVLGEDFDESFVAGLCPEVSDLPDVLDRLTRLQILRRTGRWSGNDQHFTFVQSVVRQVAHGMLSRRDRRAAHLRVVELLQSAGDLNAPAMVRHLLEAVQAMPEDPDVGDLRSMAIDRLRQAAARDRALGSPADAAAHLRTALPLVTDALELARVSVELGEALVNSGEWDEAEDAARSALRVLDEAGEDGWAARAVAVLGHVLVWGRGQHEAAYALMQPRWNALRSREDVDEALVALSATLVQSMNVVGQESIDVMFDRIRLAHRTGNETLVCRGLTASAAMMMNQQVPVLPEVLIRSALARARQFHLPREIIGALVGLSSRVLATDLTEAVASSREALDIAATLKEWSVASLAVNNFMLALWARGDWAEVDELFSHPLAATPAVQDTFAGIAVSMAVARGLQPPPPLEGASSDHPQDVSWRHHAEAQRALGAGLAADGVPAALEAIELMSRTVGTSDEFPLMWQETADIALAAGDTGAVTRMLGLIGGNMPDRALDPSLRGHRHRTMALQARRDGAPPEAVERWLRHAIEAYVEWGSELYRRRTEADLIRLLHEQGRADEAAELVGPVREFFESVGALTWLAGLPQEASSATAPSA